MDKNYWQARLTNRADKALAYQLMEKNILSSAGYGEFTDVEPLDHDTILSVAKKTPWFSPDHKGMLSRFLSMKEGDDVIILRPGEFCICEIVGGLLNKKLLAERHNLDGQLIESVNNEKDGLGFFYEVKKKTPWATRKNYLTGALAKKSKTRLSTLKITPLSQEIDDLVAAVKAGKPISHIDDLKKAMMPLVKAEISRLTPDRFEKLITTYFQRVGATSVDKPSKVDGNKDGDCDVEAYFEPLKHYVHVQAKWHNKVTDAWAVEQINDYIKNQKTGNGEADGGYYTRVGWVITSAAMFSDGAINRAIESNIILVTGNDFIEMIIDLGLDCFDF